MFGFLSFGEKQFRIFEFRFVRVSVYEFRFLHLDLLFLGFPFFYFMDGLLGCLGGVHGPLGSLGPLREIGFQIWEYWLLI